MLSADNEQQPAHIQAGLRLRAPSCPRGQSDGGGERREHHSARWIGYQPAKGHSRDDPRRCAKLALDSCDSSSGTPSLSARSYIDLNEKQASARSWPSQDQCRESFPRETEGISGPWHGACFFVFCTLRRSGTASWIVDSRLTTSETAFDEGSTSCELSEHSPFLCGRPWFLVLRAVPSNRASRRRRRSLAPRGRRRSPRARRSSHPARIRRSPSTPFHRRLPRPLPGIRKPGFGWISVSHSGAHRWSILKSFKDRGTDSRVRSKRSGAPSRTTISRSTEATWTRSSGRSSKRPARPARRSRSFSTT